jgi:BolA family transcriptional regulator, general stress-responsive regulator
VNTQIDLVALFRSRLNPLAAVVLDVSDDSHAHAGHAGNTGGGHLSAKIVSQQFAGLSTVARHRAVYALVADLMPATIHALSLVVQTPEEAERVSPSSQRFTK